MTRNALCHEIKSGSKGQAFICSPSHQNITREAKKSFKPVIGVCHSG
jgi:ligand-binding sensor protein